ncbi:hypothetical protein [Amycolatopsis sp. lyj-23]|uniref:hypothetical protein n=1 Tax=Amycolatopsis sp. lyj-23 TaxID=2789283 RepID=UPI00397C252A
MELLRGRLATAADHHRHDPDIEVAELAALLTSGQQDRQAADAGLAGRLERVRRP